MANQVELKHIARARFRTVNILMSARDWEGAAYMMGYVLEIALKAVTCKTLNLLTYPDKVTSDKIAKFFRTHEFDVLLTISGMEDLFGFNGSAFQNWSEFTQEYPGNWPEMRYDPSRIWDETKVRRMCNNLIDKQSGLITIINRKKRW